MLVIVEGETDAESSTVSLGEVFANEEVAVEITRQDITTEWKVLVPTFGIGVEQ